MPVFPGDEPPVFKKIVSIEEDGYLESRITIYTHTGTHVDAPSHMLKSGKPLDGYELGYFIGNAVVADMSNVSSDTIKKEDLMWNGEFLRMTSDAAMMFPMFEMAGNRFKFIKERVYVHNVGTPFNDHKVDGNLQYKTELYVRGLKRYKRLDSSQAAHMRS
jgi:hypothetical protein